MFPSLLPSLVLALAPATALFASASLADASPPSATAISIVHRYLPASPSSDAPLPAWTPRLTVHLDQPAAGDGRPATVSRVEELEGTELPGAEGWYQVALDGGRSFTSVRACLLPAAQQEVLTLRPSPDGPSAIYHVDYALAGIPRDGACPASTSSARGSTKKAEIVVRLAPADRPTPLILGAPPPVDAATGLPAEPVPEKSFIQKYWIYFALPIGLLLMLPEEAPAAPAAK